MPLPCTWVKWQKLATRRMVQATDTAKWSLAMTNDLRQRLCSSSHHWEASHSLHVCLQDMVEQSASASNATAVARALPNTAPPPGPTSVPTPFRTPFASAWGWAGKKHPALGRVPAPGCQHPALANAGGCDPVPGSQSPCQGWDPTNGLGPETNDQAQAGRMCLV